MLVTAATAVLGIASTASASTSCTATGFYRDGINMTAAMINPGNVKNAVVDATGCNIGIYYGPGSSGSVMKSEIYGANYFGVVNDGGRVNVSSSSVHNIGEVPFNGSQHGVGVYFTYDSGATGNINGNTVYAYQKGGIVVNGGSDSANVFNNTVTGLGRVNFIAGNGIQIAFGASGNIYGNTVSGNAYTGANNASSAGVLVFGGCGDPVSHVSVHNNTLVNNDMGVYFANYNDACDAPADTPTSGHVHNNTISNDAVSNISGNGGGVGYQAGIVDVGNGDSIHNNSVSGVGYDPAQSTPTVVVMSIDTTFTTNPRVHNNTVG
jgi:hypothetical protein